MCAGCACEAGGQRDGGDGSTCPTISMGSPVSRSRYVRPSSAASSTSRPVEGVRKRYSWRGLIGVEPSNGHGGGAPPPPPQKARPSPPPPAPRRPPPLQ